MFTVGLTGGIGSGKSTVADCFAVHGVPVIDTMSLPRSDRAWRRGAGGDPRGFRRNGDAGGRWPGSRCPASRVFADAADRRRLEAICTRAFGVRWSRRGRHSPPPMPDRDPPAGGNRRLPRPAEPRAGGRLPRRTADGTGDGAQRARHDEVAAILAAQAGRAERLAAADDVIVNTASPEALRSQVAALHRRYQALASAPPP